MSGLGRGGARPGGSWPQRQPTSPTSAPASDISGGSLPTSSAAPRPPRRRRPLPASLLQDPRPAPSSPSSRLRLLSWQFYGRISLLLSLHICLSDLITDVLQIDLVSDLGAPMRVAGFSSAKVSDCLTLFDLMRAFGH